MDALYPQLLALFAACPRVMALVALMPGFDATFVPPLVRVILSCGVAFALSPLLIGQSSTLLKYTPQGYVAAVLSELLLGALLGFLLSCLLEAARLGGELIDLQIGFRAGALFDPLSSVSSSVLGRFWYLLATMYFLCLNGHHWLLAGLMRSFQVCPVGQLSCSPHLVALALSVVSALFMLALKLAAPVIAALILADLTLGLVGRGMPQMNVLMVGMPGKILVGLIALALSCPVLATGLGEMLAQFREVLLQALRLIC